MADKPTLYLKHGCPFCMKLRIFLIEAGYADRVDAVLFEDGDETHRAMRARLSAAGLEPSFPALEDASGDLSTGTDDLIARFADAAGVDPAALPVLQDYATGLFPAHLAMFKELKALRA